MNGSTLRSLFLVSIIVLLIPGAGNAKSGDNFSSEVAAFYAVDKKNEMADEMKRMHFVRSGRHLQALLQELRAVFAERKGTEANDAAMKVEEMVNDASMLASQAQYREGIAILVNAHNIVTNSLTGLRSGSSATTTK